MCYRLNALKREVNSVLNYLPLEKLPEAPQVGRYEAVSQGCAP